ncbi:transcriptional regulator [Paenibacillus terreus]|uniref:Transcriptional regulator n=1 Tax=Paenibacillus terreus TaxID=1387834 RepID=A0ABV5B861_9BACL
MSEFGAVAGLNPGTVSGIVMGNRSIAVHQLDCITKAMDKPEDYFYNRYVQEYMLDAPLNWRRVKPFLQRCMELNRLDCIAKVVDVLMENVTYYAPLVFELAEDFFAQERYEAAALLYKNVAFSEKHQHSERLAVCQYRLFKIRIGDDQVQNLKAAVEFGPYAERLDELEQLDALKDLANLYRSMGHWDKVFELAQDMGRKARILYDLRHNSARLDHDVSHKLSRPFFFYVAYSDFLMASASDEKGDYAKGLEHIRAYADLSWVKEQDEDTRQWMASFQQWANVNTCVNRLMSGDISVLPEYIEYIEGKKEVFAELLNVVEVANRHNLDIDPILERFEHQLKQERDRESEDIYSYQVLNEEEAKYWYELSKYQLHRKNYSHGFKNLIDCLQRADKINNKVLMMNCVGLFEYFRSVATSEIKTQYNVLIREVWERNGQKGD